MKLYAISVDPPDTSKDFAAKIASDGKGAIDFSLLSDPGSKTIDTYRLRDPAYAGQKFDGIPHPAVYVIDKSGRVAWAKIESDFRKRPTNEEIRAALDKLNESRDESRHPAPADATLIAGRSTGPCLVKDEYKQFDFWLGEWDVTDKGKKIATNSIQQTLDNCIILENYSQSDGYTGKSFNFFDANLGKWRQTWVDRFGNVGEFVGEYKERAMRFEGESHGNDGAKVLRRMIIFDQGPDRVRQYSERSYDGGKTWSVVYDFIYLRKV